MMTLIIFLLIIIFIVVSLILLKIRIDFEIKINNLNIEYKVKTRIKSHTGKFILQEKPKAVKRSSGNIDRAKVITNFLKGKTKLGDQVKNVIEVTDLDELKINVSAGLMFMTPTIILIQLLNIFIPRIYYFPFKKKKTFYFSVLPIYDKFKLLLNVSGKIRLPLYVALFWFFKIYKKLNN